MDRLWHKQYDPGVAIDRFLKDAAEKYPNNTALIFFDSKMTYAELDRLVNRFGVGLQKLGV